MKHKILFLITASFLIFVSCKDSDDGIEPEKPKAPESLVGDYFLSGIVNTGNRNTTVIDDMESYISFNDDYTGTLHDAEESVSSKFSWNGTKESLYAGIDGVEQLLKVEDKEYKNIPYSKLIVKRTVEDASYDYIYIKANKTEASAEWKRFTQYDVVDKTVTAMNNAGMVAEVQTMTGRTDLLFNYGRKLNDGSMDWFIVEDFGQGKNPAVSLTDDDKVIVLFTPHDKEEGISCRVGDYDKNTKMMTWKAVSELDPKGRNPSVSLGSPSAKAGTYPSVIMAYEGENGNIVSRIGLIDLYFPQARSLTAPIEVTAMGKNPSIAIASEYTDATAVITYTTEKNNISYAVATGLIGSNNNKITWGTGKLFGEGLFPAISLNNREEVILSYKAPELPILMYSLGKLKISDNSISFTKEDQYGAGKRYSISVNNMGDVLEVRRNKGMQWYYSSNLTGQARNWMSKIDGNTLLSSLTIPGTHDSAARYGSGSYKCQFMSINEQLYAGVRFFDIRLIYENDELMAYHGETTSGKQYITLAEICRNITDFTKACPGEAFIVCLKNEKAFKDANDLQAFNKAVKDQVELQSYRWYTGESVKGLKLGDVRDKMILLRRYDATEKFATDVTAWRDDKSFTISDYIHVQDEYNVKVAEVASIKWPLVENMLKEASGGKDDEYYINFTSGTGGITPYPVHVAQGNGTTIPKGLIDFLGDYLNTGKNKRRFGIVVMDFPTYGIIDNLIESNN
ncbi:MAG: phosphatidylinositol-specific phospholipase C [Prevotella sp.]|jgi:1-phosphatidylinositol phosphodiesterase|nr:phosphatidylinositol-specific phospholipase C [Prevotella sp.]